MDIMEKISSEGLKSMGRAAIYGSMIGPPKWKVPGKGEAAFTAVAMVDVQKLLKLGGWRVWRRDTTILLEHPARAVIPPQLISWLVKDEDNTGYVELMYAKWVLTPVMTKFINRGQVEVTVEWQLLKPGQIVSLTLTPFAPADGPQTLCLVDGCKCRGRDHTLQELTAAIGGDGEDVEMTIHALSTDFRPIVEAMRKKFREVFALQPDPSVTIFAGVKDLPELPRPTMDFALRFISRRLLVRPLPATLDELVEEAIAGETLNNLVEDVVTGASFLSDPFATEFKREGRGFYGYLMSTINVYAKAAWASVEVVGLDERIISQQAMVETMVPALEAFDTVSVAVHMCQSEGSPTTEPLEGALLYYNVVLCLYRTKMALDEAQMKAEDGSPVLVVSKDRYANLPVGSSCHSKLRFIHPSHLAKLKGLCVWAFGNISLDHIAAALPKEAMGKVEHVAVDSRQQTYAEALTAGRLGTVLQRKPFTVRACSAGQFFTNDGYLKLIIGTSGGKMRDVGLMFQVSSFAGKLSMVDRSKPITQELLRGLEFETGLDVFAPQKATAQVAGALCTMNPSSTAAYIVRALEVEDFEVANGLGIAKRELQTGAQEFVEDRGAFRQE